MVYNLSHDAVQDRRENLTLEKLNGKVVSQSCEPQGPVCVETGTEAQDKRKS